MNDAAIKPLKGVYYCLLAIVATHVVGFALLLVNYTYHARVVTIGSFLVLSVAIAVLLFSAGTCYLASVLLAAPAFCLVFIETGLLPPSKGGSAILWFVGTAGLIALAVSLREMEQPKHHPIRTAVGIVLALALMAVLGSKFGKATGIQLRMEGVAFLMSAVAVCGLILMLRRRIRADSVHCTMTEHD